MTRSDLGRWALIGSGPAARFLLERWRLRSDFPLVAAAFTSDESFHPIGHYGLPSTDDWRRLLADPHLSGVILAVPRELRAETVQTALSRGKRVLIESSPGPSGSFGINPAEDARRRGSLGVFHLRRPDPDFHRATAAAASGRLGTLRTVRWMSCEYAVPPGCSGLNSVPAWTETLQQMGPSLFEQLALITGAVPGTVEAWALPETSGFQTRLEYSSGLSAWIDVQRAAFCGTQTGWMLEGSAGGYRQGRLTTLAEDGEVIDEDVSPENDPADDDVFWELRRLALCRQAAEESLQRAIQAGLVLDAIQASARERRPIPILSHNNS
jgi:predicted dehydrogenase